MPNITTVTFHGASLIAQEGRTPSETLVAMKPVVEGMGLDWSAQFRKLQRNPVLSKGVAVMAIPSARGTQGAIALPLTRLNFWLATVEADRIKDADTRARVIEYQEECADVLFAHFFGKAREAVEARQHGGITKAVVGKALDDRLVPVAAAVIQNSNDIADLKRQVMDMIAAHDERVEVVEGLTSSLAIAEQQGVPQKGRRGLIPQISKSLKRFCDEHNFRTSRRNDAARTRLFDVNAVEPWLRVEGYRLILRHINQQAGTPELPLREMKRAA